MSLRSGFPRRRTRFSGFKKSSNTADVVSWITRGTAVGGTTDALDLSVNNILINSLVAAGLRSKIKRMNGYGGTNQSQCSTPIIADVGTPQDLFVAFIAADYSRATGLTGNGTSKYIKTGTIPSTMLTFNSNTLTVYMRDALFNGGSGNFIGCTDATNDLRMRCPDDDASVTWEAYGAVNLTAIPGVFTTPWRLMSGTRTAVTAQALYQQGVSKGISVGSSAGAALPTTEIYMFASNNNGTPFGFHPNSEGCYIVADGMTAGDETALSTIIQAYQTGYSRQV